MKKIAVKLLPIAKKSLVLAVVFVFLVTLQALAVGTTFNQSITAGSLSMDIVDDDGASVGSPSVDFAEKSFSFDTQDSKGYFAPTGAKEERIRVSNPTGTATWVVNLGAVSTASWTDGSKHYDFNDAGGYTDDGATTDADSYGGQMTVDPSGGTQSGVPSSTACPITNVSVGSEDSFVEGSKNSIDIFTAASGAPTYCRFDYVGVADNITQKIPAGQAAGSYSLSMTVTVQ